MKYLTQPEPWKPSLGQKRGVKWLLENAAAGLFADPGVGKTSCVLAAFSFLKKRGVANKMLVVAPLRPAWMVWPAEVEKWTDFRHLRVEVLHGPKKVEALAREADVYVINPDGIDWLLNATRSRTPSGRISIAFDVARFRAFGFDTLVLDELTMWKHSQSGRHKAMKQIVGTFARRWGLTGTPASNGLIDLFGQMYMLDIGRAFGPYVTHFRNRYFVPSYDGFSWNLKAGAADEIYAKVDRVALRLAAEDYIDMPNQVDNLIRVDLPADARRVYGELEDEMITRIGDETIVAANAAAVSTKCRQVANGALYTDDAGGGFRPRRRSADGSGRPFAVAHDAKLDALMDLIDELQGSPILIGYEFQHDLARISARLGPWLTGHGIREVPAIAGGTPTARAVELEKKWNAGELPVLLGHPAAMGHGLNLQRAGNHVAWFGMTWNLELYDQFNRRVRRQGSRHQTVFVHHIVARDTIDEIVYRVLRSKAKTQNVLFDALRALKKRGRR